MMSQSPVQAEKLLPVGSHPTPLGAPHFPDRLHAFVWRNWQLVEPDRLAQLVGTSTANLVAIATSMGLPSDSPISPLMRKRGYITLVRRNWHLLPYDQLLTLLGMSGDELAFSLYEDDGLYLKLGSLKPKCSPLRYRNPDARARTREAEIKHIVEQHFGNLLSSATEPRFHFVEQLAQPEEKVTKRDPTKQDSQQGLRLIYSYFGGYGDALIDIAMDPYPDGLLAKLADLGVNGVWLHVVLRQLTPGGEHFPEFGDDHEKRLASLKRLSQRAKQHGIGVYLYVNGMGITHPAGRHRWKDRRILNFSRRPRSTSKTSLGVGQAARP